MESAQQLADAKDRLQQVELAAEQARALPEGSALRRLLLDVPDPIVRSRGGSRQVIQPLSVIDKQLERARDGVSDSQRAAKSKVRWVESGRGIALAEDAISYSSRMAEEETKSLERARKAREHVAYAGWNDGERPEVTEEQIQRLVQGSQS